MRKTVLLGTLVAALALIMVGCPSPTDYSVDLDQTSGINQIDSPNNFNAELITQEEEISASQTTTVTAAGVLLTWDPVEQADSYEIYRKPSDEDAWLLVDGDVEEAYFYHMVSEEFPFVVDAKYDYQIIAVPENPAGNSNDGDADELLKSSPSNTNVRVDADAVVSGQQLTAPTVNAITVDDSGQPVVTWTGVPFATAYGVFRVENNGVNQLTRGGDFSQVGSDVMRTPERSSFTYVDTSELTDGRTYHYAVVATVPGNLSFTDSAFPAVADQQAVTISGWDITLSDKSADFVPGGIRLEFDAVPGADSYKVFRSSNGGQTYTEVTATITNQTLSADSVVLLDPDTTDNDLVSGITYMYYITAVDTDAEGNVVAESAPVAFGEDATFGQIDVDDVDFELDTDDTDKIEVIWDQVDGVTGFELYRSTDGGTTFGDTPIATSASTDVRRLADKDGDDADEFVYWDTDVSEGQSYVYKVVYYTDSDDSKPFDTASEVLTTDSGQPGRLDFGTNVDTLGTVSGLNFIDQFSDRVALYWYPVDGATHYIVERNVAEADDYQGAVTLDPDTDLTVVTDGSTNGRNYLLWEDTTELSSVTFDYEESNDGEVSDDSLVNYNYRIRAAKDTDDDGEYDVISQAVTTHDNSNFDIEVGTTNVNEVDILPVDDVVTTSVTASGVTVQWDAVLETNNTVAATEYNLFIRVDANENGDFEDDGAGLDAGWQPVTVDQANISDVGSFKKSITLGSDNFSFTAGLAHEVMVLPANPSEGIELNLDDDRIDPPAIDSTVDFALETVDAPAISDFAVSGIDDDDTDGVDEGDDQVWEGHRFAFTVDTVTGAVNSSAGTTDNYRIIVVADDALDSDDLDGDGDDTESSQDEIEGVWDHDNTNTTGNGNTELFVANWDLTTAEDDVSYEVGSFAIWDTNDEEESVPQDTGDNVNYVDFVLHTDDLTQGTDYDLYVVTRVYVEDVGYRYSLTKQDFTATANG